MLKDEQKIFEKWITRYKARKFAHFYELVKFIIGPKVLVIGPFRFLLSNIYFEFVWWFGTIFFELFGRKSLLKNESIIFLSQNGRYEIL